MPFGVIGRQLFISKLLRKPIAMIKNRVNKMLNLAEPIDDKFVEEHKDLKFMIYSAHDDMIILTLQFLDPFNYHFTDVPYSSTLYFELHYD